MLSKVKKKIITPRACVMKCVFAPDEKKTMNMNLCNSFSPELYTTIKKERQILAHGHFSFSLNLRAACYRQILPSLLTV